MEEIIINIIATIITFCIFFGGPILIIGYFIYEYRYYQGEEFAKIKKKLQNYIDECNEMNDHIEELKNTYAEFKQTDYGTATNVDYSNYNYIKEAYFCQFLVLKLIKQRYIINKKSRYL